MVTPATGGTGRRLGVGMGRTLLMARAGMATRPPPVVSPEETRTSTHPSNPLWRVGGHRVGGCRPEHEGGGGSAGTSFTDARSDEYNKHNGLIRHTIILPTARRLSATHVQHCVTTHPSSRQPAVRAREPAAVRAAGGL